MRILRGVYYTEATAAVPEVRPRSVLQGNREQWPSLQRRLDVSTGQCWSSREKQQQVGG